MLTYKIFKRMEKDKYCQVRRIILQVTMKLQNDYKIGLKAQEIVILIKAKRQINI